MEREEQGQSGDEEDFYFGSWFYHHMDSFIITTMATAILLFVFRDDEDGQPSQNVKKVAEWLHRRKLKAIEQLMFEQGEQT